MKFIETLLFWGTLILGLGLSGTAGATISRIKDLVDIRGFRTNQLVGMGLVVGLSGTGDSPKSITTNKVVSNMITRLGVKINSNEALTTNVAAVIVTADLPAFERIGSKIDVKVSVIGDAKSLAGGVLLMTPLKAGDSNIYVVAQGAVVVGQASGSGAQVLSTAMIPNGGMVEKEFIPNIVSNGFIDLSLRNPDFTTSSRISEKINKYFKGFYAKAVDPVRIKVEVPPLYTDNIIEFVSDIELLQVDVDQKAVVVLNERTGTVVMGANVVISEVSISHGDLAITIGNAKKAKAGSSSNSTKRVVNMGGATVGSLVSLMNEIGMKPADLVGILQAINAAGALKAELKFL